jgi:CRISPR-associated protein Csm4
MIVKTFKVNVISGLSSVIQSDTLLGHFAWAIKFLYGDKELENYIGIYKKAQNEEDFPFIASSFFLSGKLPEPISGIIEDKITDYETNQTVHNTINRISGGTTEEGIFIREKIKPDTESRFFVKIGAEERKWEKVLIEIIGFLNLKGIGADTSTGSGQVKIEEIENIDIKNMLNIKNSTHYLTLSHCVSSKPVCYDIMTKYGKLYSKLEADDSLIKQPIVLLIPGSVLELSANKVLNEGVILNAHKNDRIVHFAIPFLIPIKYTEALL